MKTNRQKKIAVRTAICAAAVLGVVVLAVSCLDYTASRLMKSLAESK